MKKLGDFLSYVVILLMPLCFLIAPFEVDHPARKVPVSIIVAMIDIVPAVLGFAWFAWRNKNIGKSIGAFQLKHPFLFPFLLVLGGIIIGKIYVIYFMLSSRFMVEFHSAGP